MKINYTKQGDYLLPDLIIKDTENININKYERMRLTYLKEHKKALYISLLMQNKLTNHLISVSKDSENLLNTLMENYKNLMKNYLKKVKK